MDAVGDAEDGVVDDGRPGVVGDLGVELADTVGQDRIAQGESGHVELGRVTVHAQAHPQDDIDVHARGLGLRRRQLANEVCAESLVARRHGRMDGEDRVLTDLGQRLLQRCARDHLLPLLFGEHERGVEQDDGSRR